MLSALLGDQPVGRDELVEHSGVLALRRGKMKYIEPTKSAAPAISQTNVETGYSVSGQLYYLGDDLGERTNRAVADPEKTRELAAQLGEIRKNPRSQP